MSEIEGILARHMVRIYLSNGASIDTQASIDDVRNALQPGATTGGISIIPHTFVSLADVWVNPQQVVFFREE